MLSENLRNMRKKSGLSQEDVAEKLNTTRQSISKWENGWSTPDINTLIKLCELYEVNLDILINQDSKPLHEKKIEKETNLSTENVIIIACLATSCNAPIIGMVLCIVVLFYNKIRVSKGY